MKKNVLITGCAGFVGHKLAEVLQKKYNLYGIDNLTTGKKSNIIKNIKFTFGDCSNLNHLDKIKSKKFDCIIHLAGQSSGEDSFYDPIKDMKFNLVSTMLILDFAIKKKCKHFIYASSMSVYGDTKKECVSEKDQCSPISIYGCSKLASENYLKVFKKKKINYTSLRFFNIYGPGQNLDNKNQGMISIYLDQILNHKKLIIKGSGDRFRDFIYIDDVIQILNEIILNKKFYNHTFNVGTGKKTKVKEVVKILKEISKKNFSTRYISPTPLDQFGIYANISKIKNKLRYKKNTSLKTGLQKFFYYAK